MKCWICGNKGNTGEHLLKASDLKAHFGHVSQKKPLYFNTDGKKKIKLGSKKGQRLKSKAVICNSCNSNLTQPYDKAWEKLSAYLRTNWTALNKTKKLDLSKVFPGSSKKSLLDMHLYFVKLFGCRIIENNIPIDIIGNFILAINTFLKSRSKQNIWALSRQRSLPSNHLNLHKIK